MEQAEKKKLHFQKLTPINDADISVYDEAIDFVFENRDLCNIALTGSYSAGKSSVLETYKTKHNDKKFMHISLAHFVYQDNSTVADNKEQNVTKDDKLKNNTTNISEVKESELEGKILNQLIHQISAKDIPQTNFKIKNDNESTGVFSWAIIICFFFFSSLYIGFRGKIVGFVDSLDETWLKFVLRALTSDYEYIVIGVLWAIFAFVCIYNIVLIQKNKNIFRKLSFQGNDIEIFSEQDDSYFDKYLNEVLYLFQKVDANVIVFEDLDRYNAPLVFERLREINILVNKKKKESEEPLRFFYLLRDDVFISKDRTKFFDYIIPIIPVLDSSNSYDQFIKHFREGNMLSKIDNGFLQRLSLYVDDMRILKNIYNEFVIYIHKIDTTELDWNKMLALIVYKNIFPRDFSDLQLGKGFVHELFALKKDLVKSELKQLKLKKQGLLDDIEIAKQEILISEKELDAAYNDKETELPHERFSSVLTKEGQRMKKQYDEEKENRKEIIIVGKDKYISQKEEALSNVEHDINVINTKLLKELIDRDNEKALFENVTTVNPIGDKNGYQEIKSSDYFDLLKLLIRDGYIDETYNDYMTFFYEDSLSVQDKTYLRMITDRRGKDYEYKLKNPEKVILSPVLRVVDFEEVETLNFDLFQYMLDKDTGTGKIRDYIVTLYAQLKKNKDIDFISKYYDSKQFVEQFIINMNVLWSAFFHCVYTENLMSIAQLKRYSVDTIYLSQSDVIQEVNIDGCLTKYISENEDYLNIIEPKVDCLISGFLLLNVKFESIDYKKANKNLFDEVYENNLYVLSAENIFMMIREEYNIFDDEKIKHQNFTIVCTEPEAALSRYILENMDEYVGIVTSICSGKISDEEKCALIVLNNQDVSNENKQKYMTCLITKIHNLSDVEDFELWADIVDKNILLFSVESFMSYFNQFGLDNHLVNYLNNYEGELDFLGIEEKYGEDKAGQLFDSIALNNDVDNQKYEKILNDLRYVFSDYSQDEIAEDKFNILIRNNILDMSEEGLTFVRNKYKSCLMFYIKHNISKYIEVLSPGNFDIQEAKEIINWDIADEKKISILQNTSEEISIVDKNLSDNVIEYILTSNMDSSDDKYLYANYSKFGASIRVFIYDYVKRNIDDVIAEIPEIDRDMLSKLLADNDIRKTKRIHLFSNYIPKYDENSCKQHLDELELTQLKGIFTKRNSNKLYDKTNETEMIFNALKKNNWIFDFKQSEDNPEKFVVMKMEK